MDTQFLASNGIRITVSQNHDGKTYLLGKGGQILGGDREWTEATASLDGIAALREFFRAEEDERLGRWRWPENPDYVVYLLTDGQAMVLIESSGQIVYRYRGEADELRRMRAEHGEDIMPATRAAEAYFAAHPEPKPRPWANAKVITWRDGAYLPQIAQRDPRNEGGRDLGWYTWLGNDGRWFDEDGLAQLIGDADVTILTPEATS